MNKSLVPIIVLVMVGVIAYFATQATSTKSVDVDKILAKAKAENKPVFFQMSDVGCTTCQRMEGSITRLRTVYSQRMIIQKIDIGKNPEVQKRYQITAVPTQVFLTPDGEEVNRHVGYYSEGNLEEVIKEMLDK